MAELTKVLKMDTMQTLPKVPILNGVYTLASSENVEEYLKALGVGIVPRKVQAVTRPNCTIHHQVATNMRTILIESIFKTKETAFKPMENFSDETFDGRKCQSNIEVLENGRIFAWTQNCEEGPNVLTVIRSTETGFTWAMEAGEFHCEFKYRRGLPLHQMLNNVQARNE